MKKPQNELPNTWDGCKKEFLAWLPRVSQSYDQRTIFQDSCRLFSLSIRGAVTTNPTDKESIEEQYNDFLEKYGKNGMEAISHLFALTIQALEISRSDFLGHIYEAINATVKSFGQYFTPDSVARFMARCTIPEEMAKEHKIVTLYDPTSGAGALLIEAAEAFVEFGGRQGDLLVYADDLDATAACIAYVQFSLLGYPAVVRRMDTLALKVYEGPWFTPGYFLHSMPMRRMVERMDEAVAPKEEKTEGVGNVKISKTPQVGLSNNSVNVRELVQQEFNF